MPHPLGQADPGRRPLPRHPRGSDSILGHRRGTESTGGSRLDHPHQRHIQTSQFQTKAGDRVWTSWFSRRRSVARNSHVPGRDHELDTLMDRFLALVALSDTGHVDTSGFTISSVPSLGRRPSALRRC
eukprot:4268936-Alexandrium_andersonii.AAC.1